MSGIVGKALTDDEAQRVADEFEAQEFSTEELARIRKTRRRSPRLGDTRAEVYSFRAPSDYKERIRKRAEKDDKTESQVIRDALDAYL